MLQVYIARSGWINLLASDFEQKRTCAVNLRSIYKCHEFEVVEQSRHDDLHG